MIEIEVKLFGAFKRYEVPGHRLTFNLDSPLSVQELRSYLAQFMGERIPMFGEQGKGLIFDSAIANDEEILLSQFILDRSCRLHLLPPVCGG